MNAAEAVERPPAHSASVRADRSAQLVAYTVLSFEISRDGTEPRDAVEKIIIGTGRADRQTRRRINMRALAELCVHTIYGTERIHPQQSEEWIIHPYLARTGHGSDADPSGGVGTSCRRDLTES